MIKKLTILTLMACAACMQNENAEQVSPERSAADTIFSAKRVHIMDADFSTATAVAIKDNLIVATGSVSELIQEFPHAEIDDTFAEQVIVPGLIDPHMHVLLGSILYSLPFATPWSMAFPDGDRPGYPTRQAFLDRVAEIVENSPGNSPVFIYGYHNLVQGDLTRLDLDPISPERPVFVWHYSAHDFYLNSAALEMTNVTPALHKEYEGIGLLDDGSLSGRVYEDALPHLVQAIGIYLFNPASISRGADTYFSIMQQSGITTTAEMAYGAFQRPLEDMVISNKWSIEDDGFRLFLIPEFRAFEAEFGEDAPATVLSMANSETPAPAPVLPRVKFFSDGAFYSQTMRVSSPGYLAGQSAGSEGLWVVQNGEIAERIEPYWSLGLDAHIHSNGDAAQTATLAALATLREDGSDNDFVIEHAGLFSPAQIALAAEHNAMISAASHYVYYMSDSYKEPLGPERSTWISPLGDLSKAGAIVTLHSDAPLAPPDPLRAAGIHITRQTRENTPYETEQALTPEDALQAITLDAARVLGLDEQLGSIEPGKIADFTILGEDPIGVSGAEWDEIPIWGVVLAGEKRPL